MQLHANPGHLGPLFVYEGVLTNSIGEAPSSAQSIQLQILYAGSCILYQETHPSVSLSPRGDFSVIVGTGNRSDSTNNTAKEIFASSGSVQCHDTAAPNAIISGPGQRTLRIKVGSTTLSPDVEITHVPFALNAQRLEDKKASDFVQTTAELTQARLEEFISTITAASGNAIKWDGNNFVAFNPNDGAGISPNSIPASSIQGLPFSKITGVPAPLAQIGGLTCTNGKILKVVGGVWTCSNESGITTETDPTVQAFAKQAPGNGLMVASNQLKVQFGSTAGTAAEGNDSRLVNAFAASTTLGGDLAGTLPTPDVVKIRGNDVQSGTLNAVDTGKVYRWNGSAFAPTFLNFGDLRTAAGAAQLGNSCLPNQKIQWSSISDAFTCENIGQLDAGTITQGTISSARLPAASATQDGIVTQLAQSFNGIKTFLDDVIVQSSMTVNGLVSAERIQVGSSATTCDTSTEGSLRYNSTSKKFEGCNGIGWAEVASSAQVSVSIGSPNKQIVSTGSVDFIITYGAGINPASISLSPGDIIVEGANTDCQATINGTDNTRTVTVSSCSGTGTVQISLKAGTATGINGQPAPAAGPSSSYFVDNSAPSTPENIAIGEIPVSLTKSPAIFYTASIDTGHSVVSQYQVRVKKVNDNLTVKDWTNHYAGTALQGLTLEEGLEYNVDVRSLDALGNSSTASTSVTWKATADPCLFNPSIGQTCAGGAIYLGTLTWGSSSVSSGPPDRYMTTPGGCGDIPAGKIGGGANYSAWPNANFTPTCSGVDTLMKHWNDGNYSYYDFVNLTNQISNSGVGYGNSNTDDKYGSQSTTEIAAVTDPVMGGYHAAARYCDKLVLGGYDDWYLPNRYELNLFYIHKNLIPGLDTSGSYYYWSSTEFNSAYAWYQRFLDGYQHYNAKYANNKVRCVRRF